MTVWANVRRGSLDLEELKALFWYYNILVFIPNYAFSLCTPLLLNFLHCFRKISSSLAENQVVRLLTSKFRRLDPGIRQRDLGKVCADQF